MSVKALVERASFAGGELGETLPARADLGKFQISVEAMENYVTLVEGGATRTPGTRFVLESKDQTQRGKFIPFRLSSTDYYMLCINGGKARFVRAGGFVQNPDTSPFEIDVPWTESDLDNLRWATAGNTIFVVDGVRFKEIVRNDTLSWSVSDYRSANGPVDTQNLDTNITIAVSAVTGAITLAGVGSPFKPGHVGAIFRIDEKDLSLVPLWSASETGMTAGTTQRRWNGNVYLLTANTASGPNAPTHEEGTVSSGNTYATWQFLHPGYGFVRITGYTNANSVTATVLSRLPDSLVGTASYRWSPPAWSDDAGFPKQIAWNSARLALARDDIYWNSELNDPHGMKATTDDDAAVVGRLRSPNAELVEIQWLLAAGALIVGTSDNEWRIFGAAPTAPVTPNENHPVPDTNDGSAFHIPAAMDGGVLFIGKSGKRLHYAKIDPENSGSIRLSTDEISVFAKHIVERGIVRVVWQRDPLRIAWILLGDGTLAGLTFMPKQQVLAFHRHPRINAFIEDIAVIPSLATGNDEVNLWVRRTINGVTRRYVEQLMPFFSPLDAANPTAEGAWFLDCALRYQAVSKVTEISGLGHLEGQEVGVFADGAMQKRKTVVGGKIKLDRGALDVLVGIPLKARIRDLARNLSTPEGSTTGKAKLVNEAFLYLYRSAGGTIASVSKHDGSAAVSEPEDIFETGAIKYGAPLALFSGPKRITLDCEIGDEAQLELVNDDALPSTVLALSPMIDVVER